MSQSLTICLCEPNAKGRVEVTHGTLAGLEIVSGTGSIDGDRFALAGDAATLRVNLDGAQLDRGAQATCVTLWREDGPVTFFARDALRSEHPVYMPDYGLAAVPADDGRSYAEIASSVAARGLVSDFMRFAAESEESYATAAAKNRDLTCPTWLGLARDMRLFRVRPAGGFFCDGDSGYGYWGNIVIARHSQVLSECDFAVGSGAACRYRITRRLDEDALPILHSEQTEGDMSYQLTLFATVAESPQHPERIQGTDVHTAYAHFGGQMLSAEETERRRNAYCPEQEMVLCCRVRAVNRGRSPCYAWFKAPAARGDAHELTEGVKTRAEDGRVFAVCRLDGRPAPQDELAVLVHPGETAVFEFFLPHSPVPAEQGTPMLEWDFEAVQEAVRSYWQGRLSSAATVAIPEKPLHDQVRAGLLHCDIAAVGEQPDGPVAATIGWYAPIGTESAPIIQFFDSMGWHRLAERCLDFFIDRQKENGFIQNFGGYQSETGPWLWSMGEHWRYTRDEEWLRRVTPAIRKACECLLAWRERNKTDGCREAGCYGLVDGKVADPEDYFHQFYLNAGSYQGLARAAEMLRHTDTEFATALATDVPRFREDIRRAFYRALGRSPAVPTPDGSWAPHPPPWTEGRGAPHFYAEGGDAFTHCAFASRTSLVGPMWLPFCEALDPDEMGSDVLLKTNQSPTTRDNAALSQPYYCRHGHLHLVRGEVPAFLRTYYNQLTALADRETHTFWEHYHGASQHKTHEEGWFLMQTRWALYREADDCLHLFSGIPRAWLAPGLRVAAGDVRSHFGSLTFEVASSACGDRISASVQCDSDRPPASVTVRIPHPDRRHPVRILGADDYDAATETVRLDEFTGTADIELVF